MEPVAEEGKKRLLERRRSLTLLRRSVTESEEELLQTREKDWPDASATREAASVLAELSGSELQELREIDAALQRIKDGTYGRCEGCGGAIGRLRLRAIPEARLCLQCSAPPGPGV